MYSTIRFVAPQLRFLPFFYFVKKDLSLTQNNNNSVAPFFDEENKGNMLEEACLKRKRGVLNKAYSHLFFKYKKKHIVVSGLSFLKKSFFVSIGIIFYIIAADGFSFPSIWLQMFNTFLGFIRRLKSKLVLFGLRVRIEKIYRKAVIVKLNKSHRIK